MKVKTEELIQQMEEVSSRLSLHDETEDLARLIEDWARCVLNMVEEMEEATAPRHDPPEVVKAIADAVSSAKAYHPL